LLINPDVREPYSQTIQKSKEKEFFCKKGLTLLPFLSILKRSPEAKGRTCVFQSMELSEIVPLLVCGRGFFVPMEGILVYLEENAWANGIL